MGRIRDPVAGPLGVQMIKECREVDVGQACFLSSTQEDITLTLIGYSRFYSEC